MLIPQDLRYLATGHTADTNNNIVNHEAKLLPVNTHTTIHSSNLRYDSTKPDHPLNRLLYNPAPDRSMKKTIFNNDDNLTLLHTVHPDSDQPSHKTLAKKTIHTHIVQRHLSTIPDNNIINRPPPEIDKSETELPRRTRRLLAQLRANKSPFLLSYLNHIDPNNNPSSSCPLCRVAEHNTTHLFNCPHIPTDLDPDSLWSNPAGAAALLDLWTVALAGAQ